MLPQLMDDGLYVTLNSDDPPMFNTTLNDEYLQAAEIWGFDVDTLEKLVLNAVRVTRLPEDDRVAMANGFQEDFARLKQEHLESQS